MCLSILRKVKQKHDKNLDYRSLSKSILPLAVTMRL